ncbi:hypothetical protein [Pedobacter nutrimenti]|uniref:hypothetical protein n=1 Tax=Pedobacter nutrimenti TaxID=1241337 RepID=UPI00292F7886|nr:hypothetical protein [Pedobacter nutrimenti]
MKTKMTMLKSTFLALFMLLAANSFAQTYQVYACKGTAVTLTGPTPGSGETLRWTETVGGSNNIQTGTTGATFTTPTTLTPGEHVFNVQVISGDPATTGCSSDVSADYKIFVLPDITLTLADPTNPTYCASTTTPNSNLVATVTDPSGVTIPAEVTYEFSWVVTKGGSPASNSDIGTIADAAKSSTFTVNTISAGTYAFTPTVKYVVPSNINTSGNKKGCDATTAAKSVIVTPKPTTPVITF